MSFDISNRWIVLRADGMVSNVVEWDQETPLDLPNRGLIKQTDETIKVSPGWTYDSVTDSFVNTAEVDGVINIPVVQDALNPAVLDPSVSEV